MLEVKAQEIVTATPPLTIPASDLPRRKVLVINDPEGLPSAWDFERAPQRNDVLTCRGCEGFYKVLGSTFSGDLLLESFPSKLELERVFGPSGFAIQAWRRW